MFAQRKDVLAERNYDGARNLLHKDAVPDIPLVVEKVAKGTGTEESALYRERATKQKERGAVVKRRNIAVSIHNIACMIKVKHTLQYRVHTDHLKTA
jgi:hypothetical protein